MTQTTTTLKLNQIAGVLFGGDVHHWDMRLRYHPAAFPYQRYSRWIRIPWDGVQEADLRTSAAILSVTFEELKAYLLGKISLQPAQKTAADFNSDGDIDIADLIRLIK